MFSEVFMLLWGLQSLKDFKKIIEKWEMIVTAVVF